MPLPSQPMPGMPMPGGAAPGGMGAGGPPGSPPGSPPGAPAAMAPGAGAGRQAAADHAIKGVLSKFYLALGVFEPGSKKHKALVQSVKLLSDAFGAEGAESGVPSAVLNSARNGVGPGMQPPGGQLPGAMPPAAPQPQGAV